MKNKRLSQLIRGLLAIILVFGIGPAAAKAAADISAEKVLGQTNMSGSSANQGGSAAANTLYYPHWVFYDGSKFFVADYNNHRVLIYNSLPTADNQSADVVVGQTDMSGTSNWPVSAGTLSYPTDVYSDGTKLIIADSSNSRVLIYNSIPATNGASADVVIGQTDMTGSNGNQGGSAAANTLHSPTGVLVYNGKLFVSDNNNHRVLIFNSIPTANNASADVVLGQPDMTSNSSDQGGAVSAQGMRMPRGVFASGGKLFICDDQNNRVLIYNNIPTINNTAPDVVVGQPDMSSSSANQGGSANYNTLNKPRGVYSDGTRLFIADYQNHRVLQYNSIPAANNASADRIIGQSDPGHNQANRGGATAANTLYRPYGVFQYGSALYVADTYNNRVLFYDIGPADGLSLNKTTLSYSKKKSRNTAITITVYDVNLTKRKKNWVRVRLGNKKAVVKNVRNSGDNLLVNVKLKYGKWSRKSYNLTVQYRTSKSSSWESKSKTGALTIN
ncbi:MAG: hypothetical protein FJZ04_00650 [Candidatus Moranbacteria bacterium]|nr:hypothetical protein [Candidatus Moranbacteria bacterium]